MTSEANRKDPDGLGPLWYDVKEPMYSLAQREVQLGLGPDGTTCYFSANCTQEDADIVKEFMVAEVCTARNGGLLSDCNATLIFLQIDS